MVDRDDDVATTQLLPAQAASSASVFEELESENRAFAEGVADAEYVFWIGSGISRNRVPDLQALILRVLRELHSRSSLDGEDEAHLKSIVEAIRIAELPAQEVDRIDPKSDPEEWPKDSLELILERLQNRYEKFLSIVVRGKEEDYLIWEVLDVRTSYGSGIEPDCEHLAIAMLASEGALSDVVTTNWDGLIEAAFMKLGRQGDYSVVVRSADVRNVRQKCDLNKIHGCAVLANEDPEEYRSTIVGMRHQITKWTNDAELKPFYERMVGLSREQKTLMLGLSAQDENIQQIFSSAVSGFEHTWPKRPPVLMFAGSEVGLDHQNLLRLSYGSDFVSNVDEIEEQSLIAAYAKAFLTALVVSVLTTKMIKYLEIADAPELEGASREPLAEGIRGLATEVATRINHNDLTSIEAMAHIQGKMLQIFRTGRVSETAEYSPLSVNTPARTGKDPNAKISGLPEMAATIGVLGMGKADGSWGLALAHGESISIHPTHQAIPTAIYMVQNGKAAARIYQDGLGEQEAASKTVIVVSSGGIDRRTRSPEGSFGRRGFRVIEEIDMSDLLSSASRAEHVVTNFRQAAVV